MRQLLRKRPETERPPHPPLVPPRPTRPNLRCSSRALLGSSQRAGARAVPPAAPFRLLPATSPPCPPARLRVAPPSAPPGLAPPSPAQPRPAQPDPADAPACARARARRGTDSPSERPRPACAVRAGGLRLFEQEGGHISPSRPPSPHPPGIRRRDSPSPEQGTQPLPEAPPSAAVGTWLWTSSPPALQSFLS